MYFSAQSETIYRGRHTAPTPLTAHHALTTAWNLAVSRCVASDRVPLQAAPRVASPKTLPRHTFDAQPDPTRWLDKCAADASTSATSANESATRCRCWLLGRDARWRQCYMLRAQLLNSSCGNRCRASSERFGCSRAPCCVRVAALYIFRAWSSAPAGSLTQSRRMCCRPGRDPH